MNDGQRQSSSFENCLTCLKGTAESCSVLQREFNINLLLLKEQTMHILYIVYAVVAFPSKNKLYLSLTQ